RSESVLEGLLGEKEQLEKSSNEEIDLEKRIEHFRKVLEKNEVLTEFDRCVFESIVEKVIIGEVDDDGNTNPYKLTFIYKTEYSNSIQSKMHKQTNRKRTQNDVKDVPSHPLTDTYGMCGVADKRNYIEIFSFKHFHKHFVLLGEADKTRNIVLKNYITFSVVIDLRCGNTIEKIL